MDDAGFTLADIWGGLPVILEIGFGTGAATVEMAQQQLDLGLLAIDVHTPGIGDLLHRVRAAGLTNVRVMEAD
ncbi:MAG: tRNA (guanosine(46)-N7)-methyltransferase TrmB, partial [Actinobacteria bacterium]|nr:tRNA (guanosine(46)-N7)-methyltransferase TrmB [Actinomycetota bacterium]